MRTRASSPRPAAASARDRAADNLEPEVAGRRVSSSASLQARASSICPSIERIVARWAARACTAHGALKWCAVSSSTASAPSAIGHRVVAVRRAPADDADPVGLGQLIEVDGGEDGLEPLGFVAAEVELGRAAPSPWPHHRRPRHGARAVRRWRRRLRAGRAARRVQHVFSVDGAPGVEPPGHEADPVVATAGADGIERLGELPAQPPPPKRRELAKQDLREQRVSERHPGPLAPSGGQ